MAILPRYQKAGVQLQQMRELDQSGFREVARMGQTITEVVDRMSDFAYKRQAAKAKRRGEQAIMDQGLKLFLIALLNVVARPQFRSKLLMP
jgi:hypothetical protein